MFVSNSNVRGQEIQLELNLKMKNPPSSDCKCSVIKSHLDMWACGSDRAPRLVTLQLMLSADSQRKAEGCGKVSVWGVTDAQCPSLKEGHRHEKAFNPYCSFMWSAVSSTFSFELINFNVETKEQMSAIRVFIITLVQFSSFYRRQTLPFLDFSFHSQSSQLSFELYTKWQNLSIDKLLFCFFKG